MPLYNLTWTRRNEPINGIEQDDSTITTQAAGSTPHDAASWAKDIALSPGETDGFTLTWQEVDAT